MVFVVYNLQMTDLIGHTHLIFHIISFTHHVNILLLWTVAIGSCEELYAGQTWTQGALSIYVCVCCIRMSIKQVSDTCNSFTSLAN